MLFQNALLTLLASGTLAAAYPGGQPPNSVEGPNQQNSKPQEQNWNEAPKEQAPKDTPKNEGWKESPKEETPKETKQLYETKTKEIKETVKETQKETVKETPKPIEVKTQCAPKYVTKFSTGESKKIEQRTTTVMVPVSEVKQKEETQVKPYTVVVTSYRTETITHPETYITSSPRPSVITEEKLVPFSSSYVETVTSCNAEHEIH